MQKTLTLVILFTLFIACAGQTTTAVFIGDSLTAGDGVPDDSNFVSLLGARSTQLHAVNQGRSGWSTTSYLKPEHQHEVLSSVPEHTDLLIFQLGANDLRIHGHSRSTIDQIVKNMETLINLFQQAVPEAEIVMMAPTGMEPDRLSPRMKEAGFGTQTNEYLEMLSVAYQDLAEQNGYTYLTLFGLLHDGMTLDGAHPTTAGHETIADHIWKNYLEDYLK